MRQPRSSAPLHGAKMSWLVTGARGFLGLELVAAIRRARPDDSVIAADLFAAPPGGADDPLIQSETLDTTDPETVAALIARHRPARILHAAAVTPGPDPGPAEATGVMRVNLGGTLAVLRACLGHPPRRLVLLSSAGVYATGGTGPMRDEDWPVAPDGPYAASKLAMEEAARIWAADLDMICVRPGSLYGPTERWRSSRPRLSLVALMAEALRAGKPFGLAAPQAGRDWTHSADAAEAIVALALLPQPRHRICNVTSGERVSNADLAAGFAAHGLQVVAEDRPPDRHEADQIPHSAQRLRSETGLLPRHDIASGIASLLSTTP